MGDRTICVLALPDQQQNKTQVRFTLYSPLSIHQSFAGLHKFDTIIKIVEGYNPYEIIVNCANMHARFIVAFLHHLKLRKYKATIHRTVILDNLTAHRIIVLRFHL